MNKLMGFLEWKEMSLPSIPWKQYTGNEKLDEKYLWTIRSAVYRGEDLNLPRLVGEDAENATKFAEDPEFTKEQYFTSKNSANFCSNSSEYLPAVSHISSDASIKLCKSSSSTTFPDTGIYVSPLINFFSILFSSKLKRDT